MANFTFEEIEAYFKYGQEPEVPAYILENLPATMPLRDYQYKAIASFIAYFEDDSGNLNPNDKIWALLQMATASGKTLIMSALILYLYKQGYRDFLFFVNRGALVEKTKQNFCDPSFAKYLFAKRIVIDGEVVKTKACTSFSDTDPNAINIVFATTAGLHVALTTPKENGISFSSFENKKVVFIADEAHHNKGETKKTDNGAWEDTVNRLYDANDDNIMLEFTATSGIDQDKNISRSYRIGSGTGRAFIYNYDLKRFRESGYTKELINLRSSMNRTSRLVQAMMFSQYRLRLFEDMNIGETKPVILCRLKDKKACDAAFDEVRDLVNGALGADIIADVRKQAASSVYVSRMFNYFDRQNMTDEMIAEELRRAFPAGHIVKIYSNTKDEENDTALQKLIVDLNNLEDPAVPYRMILTVEMLTEGWDALNLFDVVLLDEQPPKQKAATIKEAQLIGRGARYYPFEYEEKPADHRKFDDDITNENRLCETFLYHCVDDSKYIEGLRKELRKTGLDFDDGQDEITFEYKLKDKFKTSDFYKTAFVFKNTKVIEKRESLYETYDAIDEDINLSVYKTLDAATYVDLMLDESDDEQPEYKPASQQEYIRRVYEFPPNITAKAMRSAGIHFSNLKALLPALESMSQFTGEANKDKYAGNYKVVLTSSTEPTPAQWCEALTELFAELRRKLVKMSKKQVYRGTKKFIKVPLHECITDVKRTRKHLASDTGEGVSQNDTSLPENIRVDLSAKDWFVYEDNYGTTEEKKFVSWFNTKVREFED